MSGAVLPDRLRPMPPRRRSRRPLAGLALVATLPMAAPWWQVQAVEVTGFPGLPDSVIDTLQELVGRFPLAVDPQWVRRQVEVWPGVGTVDVRLEMPGTVHVNATAVSPQASVPRGVRWQAVALDGSLAGPLDRPKGPVLEEFPVDPVELRRGLEVARRVERATGGRVDAVRLVTPADYEVRLRLADGEQETVILILSGETEGERYWCERAARGEPLPAWADLRWHDRVVTGGGR